MSGSKIIDKEQQEWESSTLKTLLDKYPERKMNFTTGSWILTNKINIS